MFDIRKWVHNIHEQISNTIGFLFEYELKSYFVILEDVFSFTSLYWKFIF